MVINSLMYRFMCLANYNNSLFFVVRLSLPRTPCYQRNKLISGNAYDSREVTKRGDRQKKGIKHKDKRNIYYHK